MPNKIIMRFVLSALLLFFAACVPAVAALDITVTGGWSLAVTSANLIAGPGSDLTPAYISVSNASNVFVANCKKKNDRWEIWVRKADSAWNSNLTLAVQRTSEGTGQGSVSGGTAFQPVTSVDTLLFSGAGNRDNIMLQYQLSGMSINVSPSNYSTQVIFTVVDIP